MLLMLNVNTRLLIYSWYVKPIYLTVQILDIFIYFLIKSQFNNIYKICFNGSVLKHLNITLFKNYIVSIPNSDAKIKYWVDKISTPFNKFNTDQKNIKILEKEIMDKITNITKDNCDSVELNTILNISKPRDKRLASYGNKTGIYRFYTSSQDKQLYCDNKDINDMHIIMGTGGLGSIHIADMFSCSNDNIIISSDINLHFIYFLLKIHFDNIYNNCFNGSVLKHLNDTAFKKYCVNIPTDRLLINSLIPDFEKFEQLKKDIITNNKLYNSYLDELYKDAIKIA